MSTGGERDDCIYRLECFNQSALCYSLRLFLLAALMAMQIPAIAAADGTATAFPVCMRSDVASSTGSGSTLIFVTASAGLLSTPSPLGAFPTAFAVFLISPASISPSVMRYVAFAVIDSPGAREIEPPADLSPVSPFSTPSDESDASPLPSPSSFVSASSSFVPASSFAFVL